jgi:hypothetical protein
MEDEDHEPNDAEPVASRSLLTAPQSVIDANKIADKQFAELIVATKREDAREADRLWRERMSKRLKESQRKYVQAIGRLTELETEVKELRAYKKKRIHQDKALKELK